MNTVPVVKNNSIDIHESNGTRRSTINSVGNIVGTPIISNGTINVQVKQDSRVVMKQYDERTGIYKGTIL